MYTLSKRYQKDRVYKLLKRVTRTLLILLILNIIDGLICILLPAIMGEIHTYPSLADTMIILLSAPWTFTSTSVLDITFFRATFLVATLIVLSAYIANSMKESILYYELGVILGILLVYAFEIIGGISFLSPSVPETIFKNAALSDIITKLFLIIIFHLPLALVSLILFQIMHRYRMVSEELESLQLEVVETGS